MWIFSGQLENVSKFFLSWRDKCSRQSEWHVVLTTYTVPTQQHTCIKSMSKHTHLDDTGSSIVRISVCFIKFLVVPPLKELFCKLYVTYDEICVQLGSVVPNFRNFDLVAMVVQRDTYAFLYNY